MDWKSTTTKKQSCGRVTLSAPVGELGALPLAALAGPLRADTREMVSNRTDISDFFVFAVHRVGRARWVLPPPPPEGEL